MWFEVMTALKTHLINTAELKGAVVVMGGDADLPDCQTVALLRGPFQPATNDRQSRNELTIYIECWEHDTHEDPKKGYEKLAALEGIVMAAINGFGLGCINDKRIQVRLGQTEPDGDAFRPSVGSRTAVTIKWQ
jgi:hypothetical protein